MADLVTLLRQASQAYYNGGPPIMDDDTFDATVERLRELDPTNPFLSEIGAPPPPEGAVSLPYPMPSLDKIKPGQDQLTRFLANPGGFVISEKLDGLSALWIPDQRRLYLRGDGLKGVDVSHLVGLGLVGLVSAPGLAAIRGEILLPRTEGVELARAWVNGLVHRKDPVAADVARVRFIAYEVLKPSGMTRQQQFVWLAQKGFEVPWNTMSGAGLTEAQLAGYLKARRVTSRYDTDGLVVGLNAVPRSESTATRVRNPKDCVAFKMPLAEQAAETVVKAVHWAASAQGYLIPRLEFDPVTIGSATIQFCTAHNAKVIKDERLGPGARILVRRSGDVIPKLDAVLAPAAAAAMPAEGSYEWDGTGTHIRATIAGKEVVVARMGHFLRTLEIPGAGPATVEALVSGGLTGPAALWAASAERLSELVGPKTGASLHVNLRTALARASEKTLMIASSQMPRGVGDTKLTALFAKHPDPRRWKISCGCEAPAGWTPASLAGFWDPLAKYQAWRETEIGWIPYPILPGAGGAPAAAPPAPASRPPAGVICMTGFRDKALEEEARAAGFTIAASMTSKVTHLLVPDGDVKPSEKTKAAAAAGIPVLTRSAFREQYLKR